VAGLPQLKIKINRAAIARYGINVEDIKNLVESIVAGKPAGKVYEGEKQFDLVIRLGEVLPFRYFKPQRHKDQKFFVPFVSLWFSSLLLTTNLGHLLLDWLI
jgi:hypothetical protein